MGYEYNRYYGFNIIQYPNENIIIQYEEYIKIDLNNINKYETIYIKSPTGTGKTRCLYDVVHLLNSSNIISITSRVNLAGEHMFDLGLDYYKKLTRNEIYKSSRLVIQLESLYKANYELFADGIIILDEINSLLSHLRSPTLDNTRRTNFLCLIEIIQNAKYVVCLDADLCDWNIEFINVLRSNNKFIIYYNWCKNKLDVPACFYDSENLMIEKMKSDIINKKYFVSCFDSLTYMKKIMNY